MEIILIGPPAAGKSTLGQLLSKKLGIPQYPMDTLRSGYYKEIGYDKEKGDRLFNEEGFEKLAEYWKPFEAYAVERILKDYSNCVIDMGAGHSVHEDEQLFERVRTALKPFKNVVLLLPSPDNEESIKILLERQDDDSQVRLTRHFVEHHSNRTLATITIYNKDKTPEETCEEILQKVIYDK